MAVPGTRVVRRRATGGSRTAPGDMPEPWGRLDALVVGLVWAIGLAGLVAGWVGISGTARLTPQARWLGLGIGSLMLSGFAMVAWLVRGLARVAALRREVARRLAVAESAEQSDAPSGTTGTRLGIAGGMRRYHLADCSLLVGKDVRWVDAETLAFADTLPCGICAAPVLEASHSGPRR